MKLKKILFFVMTILTIALTISCSLSEKKTKKVITIKASNIVKKSIGVDGMTCVGCEVTLEDNISKIEGVVSVKASHTDKNAIIEFDSTKTNIYAIVKTIAKSGYKPLNK